MRWQYKVCLFLLLLSWTVFLGLAASYINNQSHHPGGTIGSSSFGYSVIWFNFQSWSVSLILSFVAVIFGLFGLGSDIKDSGWTLSDFIKIEIVTEDEDFD